MGFFDWLRSQQEINAPPPPEREHGPKEDDWQRDIPPEALRPVDADGDGTPDAISGICIAIDYVDVSGVPSNRRVICDEVYEDNELVYLRGYCLLREADRTFRADRIRRLRLPPDWNEVSDPQTFLLNYLSSPKEKQKSS